MDRRRRISFKKGSVGWLEHLPLDRWDIDYNIGMFSSISKVYKNFTGYYPENFGKYEYPIEEIPIDPEDPEDPIKPPIIDGERPDIKIIQPIDDLKEGGYGR